MSKAGVCIRCRHPVKSGGDRHGKYGCPPAPGIHGEHRLAKRRRKRRAQLAARVKVIRGGAIAGIHKKKHGGGGGGKKG